jgi:hypothetical protein
MIFGFCVHDQSYYSECRVGGVALKLWFSKVQKLWFCVIRGAYAVN